MVVNEGGQGPLQGAVLKRSEGFAAQKRGKKVSLLSSTPTPVPSQRVWKGNRSGNLTPSVGSRKRAGQVRRRKGDPMVGVAAVGN